MEVRYRLLIIAACLGMGGGGALAQTSATLPVTLQCSPTNPTLTVRDQQGNDVVSINLANGAVSLHKQAGPAAAQFWEAVNTTTPDKLICTR